MLSGFLPHGNVRLLWQPLEVLIILGSAVGAFIIANNHAVEFLCDYLRLITLGAETPHGIEELMNTDLETDPAEREQLSGAVLTMSEGLPAFGIVAAVLGIIITMASIAEPPEILGRPVAAALAATFMGSLFAYGFVGPMGYKLKSYFEAEAKYYECQGGPAGRCPSPGTRTRCRFGPAASGTTGSSPRTVPTPRGGR